MQHEQRDRLRAVPLRRSVDLYLVWAKCPKGDTFKSQTCHQRNSQMVVINQGEENEVSMRLVLESEPHGREYFDHHDTLAELFESLKRLVTDSASAAADDGIERLVGVAVVPKSAYGSESGYGYGLDVG